MGTVNNTTRKNFKCIFNDYITPENRDGVVQSIISQFQGYFAKPEVTIVDNGFILSLNVGEELSPTVVRDKILWNRFIERVTTQDSIRKIQILRLPQAATQGGSVGAFGPHGSDTGVDEIMIADGKPIPHQEYKMDMGDRPDGPPFTASVKYADPTSDLLPTIYGPGAEDGKPVDENLRSDITDMDSEPRTVLGFRVISTSQGEGSAFTMNPTNAHDVSLDPAKTLQGTHNDQSFIGRGNFFNYDPLGSSGNQTGPEQREEGRDSQGSGFFNFSSKLNEKVDESETEDVRSAVELPQARGGGQSVPDGGQVEGWYASNFGLNETYDFTGDQDGYDEL